MSEVIRPQITYSPEGLLTVKTGFNDGHFDEDDFTVEVNQMRQENLERLVEEGPFITAEIQNDDVSMTIGIEDWLHRKPEDNEQDIDTFVTRLSRILPFQPTDEVDRVVGFDLVTTGSVHGSIYAQFQRWLNAGGLDESAAKHAIGAMALPWGSERVAQVLQSFSYVRNEKSSMGRSFGRSVASHLADFSIAKFDTEGEAIKVTKGNLRWQSVDLSIGASIANLYIADEERRSMYRDNPTSVRLYDLTSNNVSTAKEALGLVLGMGALAYHAARYPGREDLFESVEWQDTKVV